MKKCIFYSLLAMAMLFCSCQNGNNENNSNQILATIEAFGSEEEGPIVWAPQSQLMSWDDSLTSQEVTVALVSDDTLSCRLQLADNSAPIGVCHLVYPASAYVGQGLVNIPALQNGNANLADLVYYAELQDGKAYFKPLGGIVQLHLTTQERLASVMFITSDTNLYLAGNFQVSNYPAPVLNFTDKSEKQITVQGIEEYDFSKGNYLYIQMAPGCFNTFQVVLQNTDGKKCTKTLKDDKYFQVWRNQPSLISLGDSSNVLIFE